MKKHLILNGICSQFAFSQLIQPHITHIYIPILTKSTPPNTSMNTAHLFDAVYSSRVPGELVLKNLLIRLEKHLKEFVSGEFKKNLSGQAAGESKGGMRLCRLPGNLPSPTWYVGVACLLWCCSLVYKKVAPNSQSGTKKTRSNAHNAQERVLTVVIVSSEEIYER